MKLEMLKKTKDFIDMDCICEIFECKEAAIYSRIRRGLLPPKQCIGGVKGWDPFRLRKFLRIPSYAKEQEA